MIPKLSTRPTKPTGVNWLRHVPADWRLHRNGYLFAQRQETGWEDLPILEVSLKSGVRLRDMDNGARKQVMADRSKYKVARQGDIAYNMMRMWQGAVGVSPADGLVSPAYVVAKPMPEVDPRYYEFLFRTAAYMSEVDACSRGIVKDRNRLYWEDFKQITSPLPPLDEQRAIVRYLDHVDRRIRRYIQAKQKLIALLEEQKQVIIHHAVTRGLNPNVRMKPSGVEWLGEVPEHWETSKVKYFSRVGNGSTPSRSRQDYWNGGTFPWLNSGTVNQASILGSDQFVTDVALTECHLPVLDPDTIIIAITGQGQTRGRAAILRIQATINQHLAYIRVNESGPMPEYLLAFLQASYLDLRRISDEAGSTKGALTCADVRDYSVPLPSKGEQVEILEALDSRSERESQGIVRAKREIMLLQEYRTRLIADVVTGQRDVREAAAKLPNDDPAIDDDTPLEDDEAAELDEAIDAMEDAEA